MVDMDFLKRIILERPRFNNIIPRENALEFSKLDKIFTIIGPRRAGKTYFLFQIMEELKQKVDDSRILYINFEDERLTDLGKEDLQKILDAYYSLFPENKNKEVYFMFDEIQNLPYWQKFVRRLYDKENVKLFLTGSSAKLLSKDIASELRGRTWDCLILPFSFKEFLLAKGVKLDRHSFYSATLYDILHHFDHYLYFGGFPEVVKSEEEFVKIALLQNYANTVLFRDVVERYGFTNVPVVKDLFNYLIKNFARPFSINHFYNMEKSAGKKISKDKIYMMADALEDSFYFFFVPLYSSSYKKQILSPKKVYVVDNGLAFAFQNKTEKDEGWFYENLVAIDLIRRGYKLNYFKKENECDFIAINEITKEKLAIQVSLDPSKSREIDGLLECMETLNLSKGVMITKDTQKQITVKNKKIMFMPLWKHLLSNYLHGNNKNSTLLL